MLGALAALSFSPGQTHAQASPAISGNPSATDYSVVGTGWLGRELGLKDEWGVKLGGLWLADSNMVVAGGAVPGGWTNNQAFFVGLAVDANKLVGWQGASLGFQFLQFNGSDTNEQAGSIAGYNSIVGLPPLNRTELLEAYYRQEMVKDVLSMRIGRMIPSYDFGNVLRPVIMSDANQNIPAVSGLLWTPIFVNASMIGAMMGYYNPGNGVTVNFTPTESFYLNIGVYDGNRARGIQTGVNPPMFNGYWLNLAETVSTGCWATDVIPASSASACGGRPENSPSGAPPRMAPVASTCLARSASPAASLLLRRTHPSWCSSNSARTTRSPCRSHNITASAPPPSA